MPIAFNCQHCGKTIKAPDGTGGKHGACPGCKKPVQVPLPKAPDDDELRVAPLLEEEDKRIRESIWEQREEPPE
jgi:hypothetical protein